MAYGLRLRIEYNDIDDVLTRINIRQDGYSGSADVRYAHAGIRVEWGDSGSSAIPLVYGSSCTIFFDAEFDYEFLYLFSQDGRKHLVEIEKAGSLFWTGFIEPDSWTEPLISTPYPVQVTAYDGLGFLKNTTFVPAGRKSLATLLTELLAETGLILSLNTNIGWIETIGGVNTLNNTIDTEIYTDKNCYGVLSGLFKCCLIYQRAGQWWLISNNKISEKTATFSGFWFEGRPEMEILPAVKQLTVVQDFGYNDNLIQNGSFDSFNEDAAAFETWTNNGVTPQQRILNSDGDKYVYIPGQQYPDTFGNQGYGLITNGISKSLDVVQSDSVFNVSLKYAEMGAKYSSLMFISVRLVGAVDTFYIKRRDYFLKGDEFKWEKVVGSIPQGDDYVTLGSHAEQSKTVEILGDDGWEKAYYNTFDNVTAYPASKIADHFESFKASLSGIPTDGLLQIVLYVPYTNRPEIGGSCFTGIKFELLDENSDQYPTEKTFVVENSVRNNYTPEDVSLNVGDYPNVENNKIIYSGGFLTSAGAPTTGWGIYGDATVYSYVEFVGRMLVSMQSVPRQNYRARLAELIPTDIVVIEDANNPGRLFVENGIAYDDRFRATEGQFTELVAIDVSAPVVASSTKYNSPKKFVITPPTANPKNIDDRVLIIDPKGMHVSGSGYMSSDYFAAKNSDVDGYTRIQPAEKSIMPYALSPDAGTPQFSIKGAILETNVSGVYNNATIGAGTLVSHNFFALDKEDQQSLKDNLIAYDPTRSWILPATDISLASNDPYFVYARVDLADESTAATIVTSTSHIEPTAEDGFVHYQLGVVNAPVDDVRNAGMLFGNVITKQTIHAESGSVAASALPVSFAKSFLSVPVGRGNTYVYRSYVNEEGLTTDEGIPFFNQVVTISGFTIEFETGQDLSGVVVEYLFTEKT